jgi:hypothetical protein
MLIIKHQNPLDKWVRVHFPYTYVAGLMLKIGFSRNCLFACIRRQKLLAITMCAYLMKLNKAIRSLTRLVNRIEEGKDKFALNMYASSNV